MNWSWVAAFGSIFGVLLTIVLWRRGRWTMLWGAAWGAAGGSFFLAPRLIRMHHLEPTSAAEWGPLLLYLFCAFALLGALLSLIGLVAIALGEKLVGLRQKSDVGRCATTAASLPFLYIALSVALEYENFDRFPPLTFFRVLVGSWILGYGLAIALLWHACRRAVAEPQRILRGVHVCMLAVISLGLLALPYRIDARHARQGPIVDEPLTGGDRRSSAPLLIIGLDGGNWRPIKPMIARGRLPTFDKLIASGRHGEVEAIWPPYWSAPAWGAIVTGHPREDIGIYEDLMAKTPGLPLFSLPLEVNLSMNPLFALEYLAILNGTIETMPPPRQALKRAPFWELLSKAGTKTAIFRFNFTYPANGQADYVVSDRVGDDMWDMISVRHPQSGTVSPQNLADELLSGFSREAAIELSVSTETNPTKARMIPSDVSLDPTVALRTAEDIDIRTFVSATRFVETHQDLKTVAVYLGGFDNVSHSFSQYRFPEDYPGARPDDADVGRFGSVIDRYLESLDRRISILVKAFPTPPNVIIVSDHGHAASPTTTIWRDIHASPGLFIASGPDIKPSGELLSVSYYDVVPSILDVLGYAKPSSLRGRSVLRPTSVADSN